MRKYFWPLIIFIKLFANRFKFIKKILLFFGFFNPGPRGKSLFSRHIETFNKYHNLGKKYKENIVSIFEFGPGESNYVFLAALKSKIKFYESVDVKPCKNLYQKVSEKEIEKLGLKKDRIYFDNLINQNYKYHDKGLESLKTLKDNKFDLIFSHSVFQHVKKYEVNEIISNLSRISKKDSIHIHYIDLRDCFSGSKNNLKFENKIWETKLFYESGFYTNRISFESWLERFKRYGFSILDIKIGKFEKDPIKLTEINKDIKISQKELSHKFFIITLKQNNY